MKPVAVDLETYLISDEDPYPKPVVLVVAEDAGCAFLTKNVEAKMRSLLQRACRREVCLVWHNAKFDMGVLFTHFPSLRPLIWDAYEAGAIRCTRLRELLIDIAEGERLRDNKRPYSLGRIAARRLGKALDKGEDSWRYRYAELDDVALEHWPDEACRYALDDGETTLKLFWNQESRRGAYALPTEGLETRADFALGLTSAWGMLVDGQQVDVFDSQIANAKQVLGKQLEGLGLLARKKGSGTADLFGNVTAPEWRKDTKTVRAMVEQTWRGVGELQRTETGLIKADESVLRDCVGDAAKLLREYNTLESTGSRFLKGLRELKGRATRSRFNVLGADSSRTSCSSPNLQQLPRAAGARECFVARPGHVLLAVDYDGQETRTWAQSCLDLVGISAIGRRFQQDPDYDPHTDVASHMLGITYEEGMRRKAAGDDAFITTRGNVKPATFGFPVGMGAAKFVVFARNHGVEITEAEAQRMRDVFYRARPETGPYLDLVSSVVGSASYGTQVQPQSGFRRGGVGFTDCANGFFQTLAAHASKQGLWEVTRRCFDERLRSSLLGSRPVNFVHDEVIVEVPEEALHEASEDMVAAMQGGMDVWVKDVPNRAGATAMRRWSKKAKEKRDENGRLMPCD